MSTSLRVNTSPVQANPLANLTAGLDSAQQAVPVPIMRGTRKVPIQWGSVVYGLNSQPTPTGQTKK